LSSSQTVRDPRISCAVASGKSWRRALPARGAVYESYVNKRRSDAHGLPTDANEDDHDHYMRGRVLAMINP